MDPISVSRVSSGSQLDPTDVRVLLESFSKPLVLCNHLTSWLSSRSWKAPDVCEDLSATPPTTFKLHYRRDCTQYYSSQKTEERGRAVFETDCTHVKASYSDFKEWLKAQEKESDSEILEAEEKENDIEILPSSKRQCFGNNGTQIHSVVKDNVSTSSAQNVSVPLRNALCVASPTKDFWVYADYKYMHDTCQDIPSLQQAVDWGVLGFQDRTWKDSTLWVGSQGACTPCHYDTYGFNLVAQLSGEKKWVLFSPEDSKFMYPTRIPFEELSVFSEVDVGGADLSRHPLFEKATPHEVVLRPGEVLLVPKHWWHYVETVNSEPSVSINTWIPVESDSVDKVREALVRTLVSTFVSESMLEQQCKLINPNEELYSDRVNLHHLFLAIERHKASLKPAPPSQDGKGLTTPPFSRHDDQTPTHDGVMPTTPPFSQCGEHEREEESKGQRNFEKFLKVLTDEMVLDAMYETLMKDCD